MNLRFYQAHHNKKVERRSFLLVLLPVSGLLAQSKPAIIRGRLAQDPTQPPALVTSEGKRIQLEGDEPTVAVLRDERLANEDFEAAGEFTGADRFRIGPIHERSMFLRRNGKLMQITYWCDVCAIRTYSPGKCQCCQEETALDPRDASRKDTDPSAA